MEIKSFRHKGLERLYRNGDARGLSAKWAEKIRAMLTAIDEAGAIGEMVRFPGWKLHPLKGSRKGAWAMWITGNMRLTFVVEGNAVSELDIEDYH
jgi:proteic killer suppression protein